MATTTEHKCPNCGATAGKNGKPFTRGTLNLHIAKHCSKNGAGDPKQQNGCCSNPSVRLLTGIETRKLAAAGHGGKYTKICDNCEEVM